MIAKAALHELLHQIETELAVVHCFVTTAQKGRMANVLLRIEQLKNRQEAEALSLELERELQSNDREEISEIANAPAWLNAVECA